MEKNMKDIRSIEEQVAEMTEEQKDKILKIDWIAGIAIVLGVIPAILVSVFSSILMFNVSLSNFFSNALLIISLILLALAAIYTFGVLIFIKIKFPYYNGDKCTYIRKRRKRQKRQKN